MVEWKEAEERLDGAIRRMLESGELRDVAEWRKQRPRRNLLSRVKMLLEVEDKRELRITVVRETGPNVGEGMRTFRRRKEIGGLFGVGGVELQVSSQATVANLRRCFQDEFERKQGTSGVISWYVKQYMECVGS